MIFRISESDAQRQKIDIEFSVAPVIASTFISTKIQPVFFLETQHFCIQFKVSCSSSVLWHVKNQWEVYTSLKSLIICLTHPWLFLFTGLLVDGDGAAVVGPELVKVDYIRVVDVSQNFENFFQFFLLSGKKTLMISKLYAIVVR